MLSLNFNEKGHEKFTTNLASGGRLLVSLGLYNHLRIRSQARGKCTVYLLRTLIRSFGATLVTTLTTIGAIVALIVARVKT